VIKYPAPIKIGAAEPALKAQLENDPSRDINLLNEAVQEFLLIDSR